MFVLEFTGASISAKYAKTIFKNSETGYQMTQKPVLPMHACMVVASPFAPKCQQFS